MAGPDRAGDVVVFVSPNSEVEVLVETAAWIARSRRARVQIVGVAPAVRYGWGPSAMCPPVSMLKLREAGVVSLGETCREIARSNSLDVPVEWRVGCGSIHQLAKKTLGADQAGALVIDRVTAKTWSGKRAARWAADGKVSVHIV